MFEGRKIPENFKEDSMVSQGELATVVGIKRKKADAKKIGRFVTDGKGAIRRLDCVDGIPQGAKP